MIMLVKVSNARETGSINKVALRVYTHSSRIQLFMETPPQLIPFIMLPAKLSLLPWLRPPTEIGRAPLPN